MPRPSKNLHRDYNAPGYHTQQPQHFSKNMHREYNYPNQGQPSRARQEDEARRMRQQREAALREQEEMRRLREQQELRRMREQQEEMRRQDEIRRREAQMRRPVGLRSKNLRTGPAYVASIREQEVLRGLRNARGGLRSKNLHRG